MRITGKNSGNSSFEWRLHKFEKNRREKSADKIKLDKFNEKLHKFPGGVDTNELGGNKSAGGICSEIDATMFDIKVN